MALSSCFFLGFVLSHKIKALWGRIQAVYDAPHADHFYTCIRSHECRLLCWMARNVQSWRLFAECIFQRANGPFWVCRTGAASDSLLIARKFASCGALPEVALNLKMFTTWDVAATAQFYDARVRLTYRSASLKEEKPLQTSQKWDVHGRVLPKLKCFLEAGTTL